MAFFAKIRSFFRRRESNNDANIVGRIDKVFEGFTFEKENEEDDEDQICVNYMTKLAGCYDVERISNGCFGTVFGCKVRNPETHLVEPGQNLACKVYHFKDFNEIYNGMLESSFKQDALAQSKLDHPHILRLFSCFTIHEDVCTQKVRIEFNSSDKSVELCHKLVLGGVMMERLSCTLSEVTKQRYPDVLPEDERKLIFKQLGSAFDYIHSRFSLCHLDIKCDNIGVIYGTPNQYKLIDFGNSHVFQSRMYELYINNLGSYKQNPFCLEVCSFAYFIMGLAVPNSEKVLNLDAQIDLEGETQYKDPIFRNVLKRLSTKLEGRRITLQTAMSMLN